MSRDARRASFAPRAWFGLRGVGERRRRGQPCRHQRVAGHDEVDEAEERGQREERVKWRRHRDALSGGLGGATIHVTAKAIARTPVRVACDGDVHIAVWRHREAVKARRAQVAGVAAGVAGVAAGRMEEDRGLRPQSLGLGRSGNNAYA